MRGQEEEEGKKIRNVKRARCLSAWFCDIKQNTKLLQLIFVYRQQLHACTSGVSLETIRFFFFFFFFFFCNDFIIEVKSGSIGTIFCYSINIIVCTVLKKNTSSNSRLNLGYQ